jgi:hypothetical protein
LALIAIENKILALGGNEFPSFGLPVLNRNHIDHLNHEIIRETFYDIARLKQQIETDEPKLLPDQKIAYFTIIESVQHKKGGIYFIDAPAPSLFKVIIPLEKCY